MPVHLLCTSHYSDYKNYSSLLEGLLRLKKEGSLRFLDRADRYCRYPSLKTLPSATYDAGLMKELGDSLHAPSLPLARLWYLAGATGV